MIDIIEAIPRWDTETDQHNPGWVLDVKYPDGSSDTWGASPSTWHLSNTKQNGNKMLKATLAWHNFRLSTP